MACRSNANASTLCWTSAQPAAASRKMRVQAVLRIGYVSPVVTSVGDGEDEGERGSLARTGLDPYPSPVRLDDVPGDGSPSPVPPRPRS